MEIITDIIKIFLPSITVMYGIFLVVKAFLNKEYEKKILELKMDNTKIVLPIRMQAYERICLFLERISLNNIIIRVNNPAFNSAQLQQALLADIRNEYNHNLSQQVYMSDEAWLQIRKAMEDIVGIINSAAELVPNDSRGIELAKKIFENLLSRTQDPVFQALTYVKNEIRIVF
ncbi:MAG: hypothetical protein EAZ27_06175 [Cytophagales bacterium]|nr:MAG: hypothetical protein EAZ27_06175 [Cytophagales bacterium]